jgi:hypothetical protein
VGAQRTWDPGVLAERRAQRIISGRDRRRAALLSAPPLLKVFAFVAAVACACSILYGWGPGLGVPLALLVVAVVLAALAAGAERGAPPALTGQARAQLTVREAWRALRPDADAAASYPRHAIWAAETADGTVQLWRLTREPGEVRAADGDYAITARLLSRLDARDTVAAAEALAEAREAAQDDEDGAVEAAGLARALRRAGRDG